MERARSADTETLRALQDYECIGPEYSQIV
jgi:hypothetical protein